MTEKEVAKLMTDTFTALMERDRTADVYAACAEVTVELVRRENAECEKIAQAVADRHLNPSGEDPVFQMGCTIAARIRERRSRAPF